LKKNERKKKRASGPFFFFFFFFFFLFVKFEEFQTVWDARTNFEKRMEKKKNHPPIKKKRKETKKSRCCLVSISPSLDGLDFLLDLLVAGVALLDRRAVCAVLDLSAVRLDEFGLVRLQLVLQGALFALEVAVPLRIDAARG
jgi:hypothetical protein